MRDEELVAAYVNGRSEGAFGGLVERYLPLVYGAALRQVRDPGMAADVAQAVFLILATKAGRLNGGPVAGWLLGVTHLAARDALKRRARRVRHELEAGRMERETAGAGEIEAVTRAIDGAMAKLGEADRTALALRYLEGQSLAEVGAAMEVSVEAAGKRVQRAVGRLRKVLAREGMACREDVIERGLGACAVAAVPAGLKGMIGQAVAGHVPATAVSVTLAKEVTRMMMMSTVKTVAAAVVIAGVVIGAPVTVLALHGRGVGQVGPAVVGSVLTPVAQPVAAAAAGKVVTLSNGSTFELVGVCVDPLHTHTWWDAEGHVLADLPLDELQASPSNPQNPPVPADVREYAFAYRIKFPAGSGGAMTSVWPGEGSFGFDASLAWAAKGQRRADVNVLGYFLKKDREKVPLEITVACGPWEAVASFDGKGKKIEGGAEIAMTPPALSNGAIKATVTFPGRSADFEYRVMAQPQRGNAEEGTLYFMNSFEPTGTMMTYGHAVEEIVSYRLERCVKAKAMVDVALAPLAGQESAVAAPGMPAVGTSRMTAIADGTYEEAVLKEGQMIDLDTGKVLPLPQVKRNMVEKLAAEVEEAGTDLAYVGGTAESRMAGMGMHVLPVNASRYFDAAPQKNLGRTPGFAMGTAGTMTFLNTATKEPATFEFQTREGGVGVMRLEVQGDGKTCYVRCKLWRSGGDAVRRGEIHGG